MTEQTIAKNYNILKKEELKELKAMGYILEHNVTKARVVLIENDDENKVFTIGFKTPPHDDTGLPHIMEHSVLCGSKNFPLKDPFIELAKGSLNTFLNAMTYSDKTVYPIASMNDHDFHNLMHVYLDAVFYPNIYENDKIMKQEGWHYDIESLDGELSYNGVVYNEMKGVFSSPEQVLYRHIQSSLLPNTTYQYESGGDPAYIPNLSNEDFIAFHQAYYHPSNSYIYLYGNVDMEKELGFIHDEYLSKYEYLYVDATIETEEAFDEMKVIKENYSISDSEEESGNTYLSYNVVVGDSLDKELYLAFQILEYVLLDAAGAPLKEALIKSKIGKDILSTYDNGIKQPIFSIIAKGAEESDQAKFVSVLEDELRRIVDEGFDKTAIKAAMNYFEFKIREANFGSYPKGLMYGLKTFDSWLYDDMSPFVHLKTNDTIKTLKDKMKEGYFEQLIKTYILDNTHKSLVIFAPEKGLKAKEDEAFKLKMEEMKKGLSDDQLTKMIDDKKELLSYQSEPTSKEALETIPLLLIDDIEKNARKIKNREVMVDDTLVVCHDIFTNEIDYVDFIFNLDQVLQEELPYLSLLLCILKQVDTKNYTYNALGKAINLTSGGISLSMSVKKYEHKDGLIPSFGVRMKTLPGKLLDAEKLVEEILFSSKLDDKERIKEILLEQLSYYKDSLKSSGHLTASIRSGAYFDKAMMFRDLTEGIGFVEFLNDIYESYDERFDEISGRFVSILDKILKKENLIVSYTGEEDANNLLVAPIRSLKEKCGVREGDASFDITPLGAKNEGVKTSSQVMYNAVSGNFKEAGFDYDGALKVLQVIFSYEYLWNEVRVKGGAYGAMCDFAPTGMGYFMSYRDPNLKNTYKIYEKAAEYVLNFDADDRDMTKYIIGAIAKMDTPLTPVGEGLFDMYCYLKGTTEEDLQLERDQVLDASVSDIRKLAPLVDAIVKSHHICSIGDEDKIEEEKAFFDTIKKGFC